MDNPDLEINLEEVYPVLDQDWDKRPVIYITYDCSTGIGGTEILGNTDDDVEKIAKNIVEKINAICRPESTNIHFWNGKKHNVRTKPGEIIARSLPQSKYEEILAHIRSHHPHIIFKTK